MDAVKKIFWGVISTAILCIPSIIFIGVWHLLKPATFWQKLLMIALGSVFLSPIQVWLLIIWAAFLIGCMSDKKAPTQYCFKNRIENH